MYSLSTCWNARNYTDGRAMLEEVRSLGFEYAELGHNTRISLLEGIFDAIKNGVVKISSVHNFCPLPVGVEHSAPNIFQFSSDDPREHERAINQTKKTLEFAARVGAPLMVTHFGSIKIHDYSARLLPLVKARMQNTPRYERMVMEVSEYLELAKEEWFERSCQALEQLIPEAKRLGVKIGIENREGLNELPLDADFMTLFDRFPQPEVVYWHDTGHAQIKENYGFINHFFQIDNMLGRMYGSHIHDCAYPVGDHCPPGEGDIDFELLKPLFKPTHLKVLEMNPAVKAENIRAGLAHIKSILGDE
ncbi:MAG: sugar phosphate isomerase/epimerase [Verrucomicrobia bacterium]|nr:sugar phosphate isomerase/epimerase [Verrucomicrobiota bacterium]